MHPVSGQVPDESTYGVLVDLFGIMVLMTPVPFCTKGAESGPAQKI